MAIDRATLSALVTGAGSIGSRHARNLRAMGVEVAAVCDVDISAAERLVEEIGGKAFSSLDDALSSLKPDIGLVCSPPLFHVPQATRLLESGAHVFVEKPLSHSSEAIRDLMKVAARTRRLVQVGYNLRFHPGLRKAKKMIDDGVLGRLLWARFEVGQYLPDWRPGRDYRQTYTAKPDLGGGILLDASHEIDYACWFMGEAVELNCMAGRTGALDMKAEDSATLLIRFMGGAQADIHVDCLQRTYARECKIVGEQGVLVWDYTLNELRSWQVANPVWQVERYAFETNDMYLAELNHFLDCVATDRAPEVGISDGLRAVLIVERAKTAAEQCQPMV